MPKLKNPKHELFCKELAKNKYNYKRAYANTYPDCTTSALGANSSRLVSRADIRDRMSELLANSGLSVEELNGKLAALLDSKKAIIVNKDIAYVSDNNTQLEATKTAYRLHGLLNNDNNTNNYTDNRAITIDVSSKDINNLDNIVNNINELNNKLLNDTISDSAKVNIVLDSSNGSI